MKVSLRIVRDGRDDDEKPRSQLTWKVVDPSALLTGEQPKQCLRG